MGIQKWYVLTIGLAGLFLCGGALPGMAQEKKLIPFKLKDQFDRVYTEKHFQKQVVIVIASDKEGSQYNERWIQTIYDSLKAAVETGTLRFMGVADVRKVPSWLKWMVKKMFPKDQNKWVLMDWRGVFAETYRFKKGVCNIAVFNARGILMHQTYGQEMDRQILREVLQKLRQLLDENSMSAQR